MTVACAIYDADGALYLAADSALMGLPVQSAATKISSIDLPPLAWATAGDEAIGDLWSQWLTDQLDPPPDPLDWERLIAAAVQRLAVLNGMRTGAASANHVGWDPAGDLTQVLLVGFVGSTAEIAHLEVNGDVTLHVLAGRHFAAIGAGRDHAWTAYQLLTERGQLPAEPAAALLEVTDLAARYAPSCAPPVSAVKVNRDGVESVATTS